jgi:hypothetical protein
VSGSVFSKDTPTVRRRIPTPIAGSFIEPVRSTLFYEMMDDSYG